ncbi:MAG TPA: hypothetical protein VEK15_14580 [Vicinamibacteria bacterium]|nr:hypothetical protein [Vicinamibacteria bacterium]
MSRLILAAFLLASLSFAQEGPDFSGNWTVDADKSDDGEALILGGFGDPNRMKPEDRRTAERLIELVRSLDAIEIRQGPGDIRLYDEADNVRIYYIDGKKHTRETPWGDRLETVTKWEASELHVRTDGKDLGEIEEIYAMEAGQLVYTVKVLLGDAKDEVAIRTYYSRAE